MSFRDSITKIKMTIPSEVLHGQYLTVQKLIKKTIRLVCEPLDLVEAVHLDGPGIGTRRQNQCSVLQDHQLPRGFKDATRGSWPYY